MAGDDDFEKADADAGAVEVLPANRGSALTVAPSGVMEYRAQLVEQYHKGASSLVEKLRQAGKEDMESLLVCLLDEMVTETDHLLGNELVSVQNGDLRDSSIMSFKRAEVLEKAIKAIQNKSEREKVEGLNVDSPEMVKVFRFFMSKAKDAFDRMGVGDEVSDLFFRTIGEIMENWKKELREHFESTKA
jgi:hypothetical protein